MVYLTVITRMAAQMSQTVMEASIYRHTAAVKTEQKKLFSLCLLLTDRTEGDVRLIKLSDREFIVQIYTNGSYRQACWDTWDHREASVVCRQWRISDGKKQTHI